MSNTKIWGMHRDYPEIWTIWKGMLERCYNPNNRAYKNYGAKGITVCESWKHCNNFLQWALQNNFKKGDSIDRIDPSKNYEPLNCQLIPISENIIKANKCRKGIKLTQYSDDVCIEVINLLETTNLSYKAISERTNVPVGTVADINTCHTHTNLHSYNHNIRKESVTTNPDECKDVG